MALRLSHFLLNLPFFKASISNILTYVLYDMNLCFFTTLFHYSSSFLFSFFLSFSFFKKVLFYAFKGLNPYSQNPGIHPHWPNQGKLWAFSFPQKVLLWFQGPQETFAWVQGSRLEVHSLDSVFDLAYRFGCLIMFPSTPGPISCEGLSLRETCRRPLK